MRILITGYAGMLGYALQPLLQPRHEVIGLGSTECDIRDRAAVRKNLRVHRPELVMHLAACTDVDGCERNPQRSEDVNGAGTGNVAQACAEVGAALLYRSTESRRHSSKERRYFKYHYGE